MKKGRFQKQIESQQERLEELYNEYAQTGRGRRELKDLGFIK